ncbi:uncharacterized protein [Nicotiana sylvestris]|uniref:uncharacterized protein n=1 Tax=Nicotiana sylvestris TaxID=4096 RepID=UPI00388C7412
MGQPQAAMPDQVQGQGVQDAPPPVPTIVPTVALHADAMARLLNVLEALMPTQGGSSAPQATLQTQAPAQTQTFGNKEVSLQEFLKLKSPKFIGSDSSADPQSFLDGTLKALRALGCSSERAADLATYKLEDMANTWYETVLLGRPAGATPVTWDEFTKLFKNHFLPDSLMQKYARDFERLVQTPDIDVSTYNTKFFKLAIYVPYLVPTDEARVQRKIENKGRDERATGDLRKKAKTGGAFSGGFTENRRARNQGQQQVLRQGHTCLHSPHTDHITNKTTRNTSGATGTGNRGRVAGDHAIVNQGQGNAGRVVTPVGESLLAEYVYHACQIRVEGRDTLADLIVPYMIDFDMLIGIDWFSSCYAIVDCHAKIVKFEIPNEPSFILRRSQVQEICKVVSFIKAQRLLKKGCLGLLAIVNVTRKETVNIENVLVVREFSDVFPEDLPELPPVREIDFGIDLLPDT